MKCSIVLPVRNGGAYVKECVQSILSQTLQNFDLLVLDNCSTDGTTEWIASLQDDRIKIYPAEKPLSIAENWARIVTVPKNEFITMIGHDDVLHPHYLAVMDQLVKQHPDASLYQAHYRFIDKDGAFMRHCLPMEEVQYAHEFLARHFFQSMESMGTGYLMRSRDYDELGGIPDYPNLIFADYELWVRLTLKRYKATTLEECFSYRLHFSTSKVTNGQHYQEAFGLYVHFLKELMQQDEKVKQVINRYASNFLFYYCESLSHRLLKTPRNQRTITVNEFIEKCETYADWLIPGQTFEPMKKFRIRIAAWLDRYALTRALFNFVIKLIR